MLSILLTVLKIIGIVVLVLLSVLILILLLVLFVPVRYRIKGYRKSELEAPVYVRIKITWLFHIVRVFFVYPEAAYIKIKFLFFTVYHSHKRKMAAKRKETDKKKKADNKKEPGNDEVTWDDLVNENAAKNDTGTEAGTDNDAYAEAGTESEEKEKAESDANANEGDKSKKSWKNPFTMLWNKIKNIWYTILKIYDKIKDAVLNIRYYTDVLKSNEFREAFSLCSGQLRRIFRSIKPRRVKVNLIVGMKDPQLTGQILEFYSILYPVIGNNIFITPDFDQELTDNRVEGDFYLKGRVSSYVLLWAAWKIYRDRNIRKIIDLLKREGA